MKIWKKNFQVLIVSDDNTEPLNIRLSALKLRWLTITASFLFIHTIIGFIFYYKFAYVHSENKTLSATNKLLNEDNQRIYQLEDNFSQIEESNIRVKRALGIGGQDSVSVFNYPRRPTERQLNREISTYLSQPGNQNLSYAEGSEQLFKIIEKISSPFHGYLPSVPTLLPVDGLITSGFENVLLSSNAHPGIDLAADIGTPVRASGDGVIVFANWTYDLGNLVILYHGNDFFSFYGHNQLILKPRMSVVRKGDAIALVGSTGQSSNPHLHFEIWKNGRPIDPKHLILSLRALSPS